MIFATLVTMVVVVDLTLKKKTNFIVTLYTYPENLKGSLKAFGQWQEI